jgi:hypothetical protein
MTVWKCATVGCYNSVAEKGARCAECRNNRLVTDGGRPSVLDERTIEHLDWDEIRTTSSWQRGTPVDAEIEEHDSHGGLATVRITRDDGDEHRLKLVETSDSHYGKCDCEGFEYNDYCAHLVAVYRARRKDDEDQGTLQEVEA